MRKTIALIALFAGLFAFNRVSAQVSVSVNIGLQPIWGPVGYDHADYYYLPDIDGYYDVPGHVFVFFDHGAWVRTAELPPRFAHFDLYHAYKVVLNERDPWMHHDQIRAKYAQFRGRSGQAVIRDSHDKRYYEIKDHPMHSQYHPEEHHPEEHHEGEHRGEEHH
jgi:hypothetical protein